MSNATLEISDETTEARSGEKMHQDETKPSSIIPESLSRDVPAKAERATGSESQIHDSHRSIASYFWLALVGLAALIAVVVTIYILKRQVLPSAKTETPTDSDASMAITLVPDRRAAVAIEVARKHSVQTDVVVPGKIAFNSNKLTLVLSQFSGRIVKLDAMVESTVQAGQEIGMIDTPDIVGIQSDYQQALAAERSARTTLDLAKRVRERSERLAAAEAIPQRDLQQAQADESRAADDLKRVESALAASRGRLQSAGMKEPDIERLASGRRAVNRMMAIVAPISGTIIERKAGIGQVVQPGAGDPLFVIADLSTVWVNADVYEDQLEHIHKGESMKVTTPAYPNKTFTARVDQIGSTIDTDKHTVAVRCVVANHDHRFKPGMFANVVLSAAARQEVLTVPSSAVVAEGDQRSVFVEEAAGDYVKRAVETGNEINGATIIRSGLKEGERVVVRGGLLLSSGQTE
jgi:membrane fusion protein, heavy metal efflux system